MFEVETAGKIIGRGATATVHQYEKDKILKLFYERYSQTTVDFEYEITRKLPETLNAPKVHSMVKVENRYGIVMEKIVGKSIVQSLAPKIFQLSSLARQFADLQISIHSYQAKHLPDYKTYLHDSISTGGLLDNTTTSKILDILDGLPEGNQICHGDFHPDNVIITDTGMVAIDWIDARRGNPLFDIARSCMLMTNSSPPVNFILKFFINIIRKKFTNVYFHHYDESTGLISDSFENYLLPIMASRMYEMKSEIPVLRPKIMEILGNSSNN